MDKESLKIVGTFKYCLQHIRLCENNSQDIPDQVILRYFKLALYIEKIIDKMDATNSKDSYFKHLKTWLELQKVNVILNTEYFSKACDTLIKSLLKKSHTSEKNLDVCLKLYASVFGNDRLENVLREAILYKASFQSIVDYVGDFPEKNSLKIKFEIQLEHWSKEAMVGNASLVRDEIENLLKTNQLSVLLEIINCHEDVINDSSKNIIKYIYNIFIDKMKGSDNNFWLNLFNIDRELLGRTCCINSQFRKLLLRYILCYLIGNYFSDRSFFNDYKTDALSIDFLDVKTIVVFLKNYDEIIDDDIRDILLQDITRESREYEFILSLICTKS